MQTKWQVIALLVILIAFFLLSTGCQTQEAASNVYPTEVTLATAPATLKPISTSYPVTIPTATTTAFNDIRETLIPDIYAVYWSQDTWYLKGLNESKRTQLIAGINSEVNTNLELSPDNNLVAFSNSSGKLSTYNLRTGEIASYYNPEVNSIDELEWLPNSDIILYLGTPEEIRVPDSNVGLYSVSLGSKELHTLLDWKDNHDRFRYGLHGIALSKDSRWLSFYASRLSEMMAPDPEYGVYLINTDCLQNPTTCSEAVRFVGGGYSPAWSPEGKLSWICPNKTQLALCVMDVNKAESPHVFLNISEVISSPDVSFYDFFWSPDGGYISLDLGIPQETNPDNITSHITIIQMKGDQPIKVTALSDMESWCVGWSPDSKYLVYEQLLGYTEPYGEIGARFPITDIYFYDVQSGTTVDFVKAPGDREVFNFFINVK